MSYEANTDNPNFPHIKQVKLADFIDQSTGEKAGVIDVLFGSLAPIRFDSSFTWPASPVVSSLEYDSRKVKPGSLYFALPGLHADGHDYIPDAIKNGAGVIVHQRELSGFQAEESGGNNFEGVVFIRVKDSRFAMSPIADSFYDCPSRRMRIIGVTGTEGKSTTVYLIYQLLKLLEKKTGFISTVQQGDGLSENWNSEHQTTPEAVTVHRLFAEMLRNGCEYAVLEASSHGLSKKTNRLGDVDFDVGVMTNVTHEHLEFHGTWEQYRYDKAELFRSLSSFGVINADDQSAVYFADAAKRKTFTFSAKGAEAYLSARKLESGADGNNYEVFVRSTGEILSLKDKLPGAFNAGNVLAALLVVSNLLSLEIKNLTHLVPQLKPVRGRMSAVRMGQPFEVLVDFAHTPSSFLAVLKPLRERLDSAGGKLICLFGSAGERDTQKRKTQGEIAARYSDIVILADEDPRGEDPVAILEEIAKGCFAAQGCETGSHMIMGETLFLIPNRPQAIRKAVSLARQGDVVLLLGKGHENSIIYAGGPVSYDEIGEAEAALRELLPAN